MKKLLIFFTITLTTTSPLLISTDNLFVQLNIKRNTNNEKQNHLNVSWYDPSTIKIANIKKLFNNNKLLLNSQSNFLYFDNVFLKSLKLDNNSKIITSSLINLKNNDSRIDSEDISADQNDYKVMETLTSNNTAIQEGLAVLNNYNSKGIINFNLNGYVPSRSTFFHFLNKNQELDNKLGSNFTQKIITSKSNQFLVPTTTSSSKNDGNKLSIHWYGFNMKLGPKVLTNSIVNYINNENSFLNKALDNFTKNYNSQANFTNSSVSIDPIDPILNDFLKLIEGVFNYVRARYIPSYGVSSEIDKAIPWSDESIERIWETEVSVRLEWEKNKFKTLSKMDKDEWEDLLKEAKSAWYERNCETIDPKKGFSNPVSEEEVEIEDLETEADEVVIGTAESASWLPVIGPIILMVVDAIVAVVITTLVTVEGSKFSDFHNSIETLREGMFDKKTKRFNILNSALVNFIGNFSVTWLQKSTGTIQPIDPAVVPKALITPSEVSPYLNNQKKLIIGTTNDFNLFMDPTTWNQFSAGILTDNLDVNKFFIKHNVANYNVDLTNKEWKNLIEKIKNISLNPHSIAFMHVVNKQLDYSNLNNKTNNFKYDSNLVLCKNISEKNPNDISIVLSDAQLVNLEQDYLFSSANWEDHKLSDGTLVQGLKNNPINNPEHYKKWQIWFYHKYIEKKFWLFGADEQNIEKFINKIFHKAFDVKDLLNMTDNHNLLMIDSSML